MKVDIYVRDMDQEDYSMILKSWLRSQHKPLYMLPPEIFYFNHKKIVKGLVKRSQVYLACNPDDLSQVFGYIVYEYLTDIPILHFIYVKQPYRGLGIASQLLDVMEVDKRVAVVSSHYTYAMEYLKNRNIIFNPYIIWKGFE